MNFPLRLLAPLVSLIIPVAFALAQDTASGDDLKRSVGMMARIRSANTPVFSPDGNTIAFISDLSGVPQVWTVATRGGWPDLVSPLDDPVSDVSWSPDGKWLALAVAPGGGMNQQVYLVQPDGSGLRRLTAGGKETNGLGPWRRDGGLLTVTSNRRTESSMDAYLVDPTTGEFRLGSEIGGVGGYDDIAQDGKHALLSRLVARGDNNVLLVDLTSRKETLLTPHNGPGTFGGLFAPDGQTVYLISNKDRDLTAFARVRLAGGDQPGPIEVVAARDDAELQSFDINHEGTTAALLWNASGRNELALVDLTTGKTTPGPRLPTELAFGGQFSHDGRRLAFTLSGAAAPLDAWVLDLGSGQFTQVTRSAHAGVELSRLVRPELVRFPAFDGLELSGWLYRPIGVTGPSPMVLAFHGGPEGQERPLFSATYQAILSRGIAVFAPNVRGSSGFGKRFVNLDNGALRTNGIKDIKSSVDYAVKAGLANPRRIGIMGGSYGGYMVMAGLSEYPDLFAAGANLYGVVNFETFFKHTEPWMAAISKVEYGDPDTQADLLRQLSPIGKVSRVVAPTIVLHGANDTNVPVVEAEQVVADLKRRGVPVEYILFPDEGHGFRKTANRIRSTVAIVRWFEKYLN